MNQQFSWSRTCRQTLLALAAASLLTLFPVNSAFAQQQKQHPRNPPVLPSNAHSSRPVGGVHPLYHNQQAAPLPNTASWVAIGPASLQPGGGLVSGRVTGISLDSSNNIYVTAAGGGVWKSTDSGNTWNPLTDTQQTLAMGSIAVAPSNANHIYAGTGEANNSGDSNHGYGVLVSTDGGNTWTLETAGGAFTGVGIGQIAVDPTNDNTAFAAVGGYTENGTYNNQNGIWKTSDGGNTWTNTTSGISNAGGETWSSVIVDPNNTSIIYAAGGDFFNVYGINGVYRSTDGGNTWALLANGPGGAGNDPSLGRIALAISSSDNQAGHHVLYVMAANTGGSNNLYYMGRSDNSDASTPTFTNLTAGTPDILNGQGWYDIALNVDSAGVVYGAGVENYNTGMQMVIRSTSKGSTWTDISIINNVQPHTDCHAIAFDSSNRMILGSDGGVFRYDNTVPSWSSLNANLNTIQFTGIGLDPTSAASVAGGSQDNGTEVYSNALIWNETDGGDGGAVQYSQTNSLRCFGIHPIGSFGVNDFFRTSTDGCNTWSSVAAGLSLNNANFYPPFILDPSNGDHVLLGTDYVNETTNDGTTWSAIGIPTGNGFNPSDNNVDSIAFSPAKGVNPQVIYAATGGSFASTSQIFVTTNDGATWVERSIPPCPVNNALSQGCWVSQIVTDPNDPTGMTAVGVNGRFGPSGKWQVFRTTDGGAIWNDITSNLPNLPTWSVKVDTDPSATMYVSNDTGVYYSVSPYATWAPYGTGLSNAQGVDLELNSALHLVGLATHGRGAWLIETPPHVVSVTTTNANGTYIPGDVVSIQVNFSAPINVTGTPQLTLDTIASAVANYTSGSGTNTLTFTYNVGLGQTTSGNATGGFLDYSSNTALSLNGGTMIDTDGVPAVLQLYAPGATGSLSAVSQIVISNTIATPVISPAAGNYYNTNITITDSSPGATIYYTTDGSTPTNASAVYTVPFQLTTGTVVKAIGIANGNNNSAVAVGGPYTMYYWTPTTLSFTYGTALGSVPGLLTAASNTGCTWSYGVSSGLVNSSTVLNAGIYGLVAVCNGRKFANRIQVTPATLTVAANNASTTYGSQLVKYTYQITGFVNGDPSSVVTGTPTITTSATIRATPTYGVVVYTSNVGKYTLTPTWGSLKAANYTFSFQAGTLTLTTSPQSLTVQPYSIAMYQSTCLKSGVPAPSYKITGLLNWDTQASTTTGSPTLAITGYTGNCARGTYTITSSPGTLALDQYAGQYDYSGINYATATLTIY